MDLDDRRLRWLLWAALAMVGIGIYVFVLRGADQPEDPSLPEAATSTVASILTGDATATLPDLGTLGPGEEAPGNPDRVPLEGFGEAAISVEPGDGRGLLAWCLLTAVDNAQRGRGLMEVTDLHGYAGMLFAYQQDTQNAYYMRNTPMPLSIAWISAEGRVVSTADMAPCEDREGCPTYAPAGPYRYAIEVPQGGLPDLGIVDGARVAVGGTCAPRG